MGNDFRFGGIGSKAVGSKDGAVVRGVGFAKFRRHCERVVEVGKGRIGVECAGVENCLNRELTPPLLTSIHLPKHLLR